MRSRMIQFMQSLLGWRLWLLLTLTIILGSVLLSCIMDWLVYGAIQKYSLISAVLIAFLLAPPTLYLLHFILSELSRTRQRELELEAHYSNSRLNVALEHSRIIIWEYDFIKDEFSYEDEKLRLLGIDLETPPHTLPSWIEHIHPDDKPIFLNRLQAITVASAPAFDHEYRFQTRPETWVWLHSQGKITRRDESGNPLTVVGATSNITERKQAETRLQQSEERYDFATRVGKVGTWDWDPQSGILAWSDETFRLIGFEPDSVTPTYELYLGLVHPDDREFLNDGVQAALHEKKPYSLDCRIVLGGGKEIVCHVTGKVEFDMHDQPIRMLGTIQDVTERKHMEDALRQSDQRFRTLFDSSPDPIWIIDGHRFVECNQAAVKMLGYPNKEALRNTHPSELSPEYQPDGETSFSKAERMMDITQEVGINRFEWVHTRANGEDFFAEVTLCSIVLQEHPVIYCVWRDISERKQTETALAESRKLLKTIIDTSPMRVFWKGRDMHYLGCNPPLARDAGKSTPEEMIGQDDFQMAWSAQAELYRADDRQVMESGVAKLSYDEPQTTPDGKTLWLRTSKVPLRNDAGEIIGILGIYEDITERKLAEQVLAESEERFRQIFNTVSEAIFIHDADTGAIVDVNQPMCDLYGMTHEQALTCGPNDLSAGTPPYSAIEAAEKLGKALTEGPQTFEWLARARDDHLFWVEVSIRFANIGKHRRILAVVRDITERKQAEDALQASVKHANNLSTMLRLISDNVPDMIWAKDLDKHYLFANRAICDNLLNATDTQEPIGKDDMFFALRERNSHPHDAQWHTFGELCQDTDAITLQRNVPAQFDEFGNVKGKFLFLDVHKAPLLNDNGDVIGVVGSARDVTEQRSAVDKLRLASLVLEKSSEALMISDANNRIVDVNPAFTNVTGYQLEEIVGKDSAILYSGRHDANFYHQLKDSLNQTGRWQGEIWNKRKNGDIYAEWLTINTLYHDDGSIYRRVGLFSDITEKKKSEELIWAQANFDQLTQLPNRRMFRDRLSQDLKKAHRASEKLALLFLDLDHFKEVNDTLGHDLGDILLVEAARRISSCVRESDTVARLGGDEFTIILTELDDTDSVDRIAAEILYNLALPFNLKDEVTYVSASIGITLYPDDAVDLEDLQKNADQAMYVAKNAGRNRFSYFTNAMQEAAHYRLHLLNDLRVALAEAQLQLYYQPIVELASGRMRKAEALLRWFHPKRGLISPAEFIPLAENSGLIHEIGDWVFEQAAKQTQLWRPMFGEDFQISVNKSPVQIQSKNLLDHWRKHLATTGLPGQNLVIEITEGLLLDTSPNVISELLAFRDAGIQVAIDDFGTGYSALSYLKKLDIDYVKIDQSFIRNLVTDPSDLALSEAMIVMAHKLGLKVIAEGVETQEQLDLLREMKCDFAQGYFYSRPVTATEFERLLAKMQEK